MKYVKPFAICFWLVIWQLLAIAIHNSILLVGPVEVGKALLSLCGSVYFYEVVGISMLRIMAGFFTACILGILFGVLAYLNQFFKEMLDPLLHVMKSIPVASFVVILLIWQGSKNLSFWISFLVVFPGICISTRTGLEAVDYKMLEMGKVYGLGFFEKIRLLYKPTLLSYLLTALEAHIGMAFKSGVAAEIIGQPDYAIGERIYMSKIYLDTAGVFAWTLTLILVSMCVEKLVLFLVRRLNKPATFAKRHLEQIQTEQKEKSGQGTTWETKSFLLDKSYGDQQIFDHMSVEISRGKRYVLMAPSGRGKTTLFRILSGLEKSKIENIAVNPVKKAIGDSVGKAVGDPVQKAVGDSVGNIADDFPAVSYMFQEDRLMESELVITNLEMVFSDLASKERLMDAVQMLSLQEVLFTRADQLSGGMKRRVALIRAMLYEYDNKDALVLLDEPFNGLDKPMHKLAADFILKYQNQRTLIVASHEEGDILLLEGEKWKLD